MASLSKLSYTLKIFILVCVLVIGGIIGWFIRVNYDNSLSSSLKEVRANSADYHYINPLLYIDNPRQAPEYKPLDTIITNYVSKTINSHSADDISVYFRELNTGKWTGTNQNDTYEPSSMMKVAIMMAYLNQSETDPSVLTQKLPYNKADAITPNYPPATILDSGTYPVRDLIEAMIINSDNAAAISLIKNNPSGLDRVYESLELPEPPTQLTDFMSVKEYSTIFRTLYNATYLSPDLSEQALKLLTYTTFKNGLVAGLPSTITVAHKFGENTVTTSTGKVDNELHDCGIVYYPHDPYLLCIMAKGSDFKTLEGVISGISNLVYTNIKTQ